MSSQLQSWGGPCMCGAEDCALCHPENLAALDDDDRAYEAMREAQWEEDMAREQERGQEQEQ